MALIKFGGGVAGASGKAGGTVFARNRSGSYSRNWAKPVNPGTPKQTAVRSRLSSNAAAWRALSAAQVAAWNAYAATMTRLNRVGESYVPTGRQIYVETANNLAIVGQPALTLPGASNVSPAFVNPRITASAATAGLFTSLTPTADSLVLPSGDTAADVFIVYYAAPAHPAQVNNVNKQRRVILTDDGTGLLGASSCHAAFNAYFGATSNDGLVVDMWLKVIDTTGLASAPMKLSSVIT